MAECETDEATGEVRIVEHHSPILDLLRAFPTVARLEGDMIQRLVGVPVRREETNASGLFCVTFRLG
jgi:predicted ArsR family transcriptional regulator